MRDVCRGGYSLRRIHLTRSDPARGLMVSWMWLITSMTTRLGHSSTERQPQAALITRSYGRMDVALFASMSAGAILPTKTGHENNADHLCLPLPLGDFRLDLNQSA